MEDEIRLNLNGGLSYKFKKTLKLQVRWVSGWNQSPTSWGLNRRTALVFFYLFFILGLNGVSILIYSIF